MSNHQSIGRGFTSQRGSVLVTSTLISVAIVGISLLLVNVGTKSSRHAAELTKVGDGALLNERALSMANLLISNNLVLCREDGWQEESESKCIWGGDYHDPEVSPDTYGLNSLSYEDGFFKVDFEQTYGPKNNIAVSTLKFSLLDYTEDEMSKKVLGTVPSHAFETDKDDYAILIEVETPVVFKQGGDPELLTKKAAIRRPHGFPALTAATNDASLCAMTCSFLANENPNPECRGPQELPPDAKTVTLLTVRNHGPGAIYRLKYRKTTQFDQALHPDKDPVYEVLNAMPGGREVLMPGESITIPDDNYCFAPKYVTRTRTQRRRRFGVRRTTTYRSVDRHYEPNAAVKYRVYLGGGGDSSEIEPSRVMSVSALQGQKVSLKRRVTTTIITNVVVSH